MSDRTPEQRPTAPWVGTPEDAARRAEEAAANAERNRAEAFALAETAREAAVEAARKAGRFSREFLVTVISVVTTAFGVVVALAWNTALSTWLARYSKDAQIVGLFVYAVLITFMAVIAIVMLSRLEIGRASCRERV